MSEHKEEECELENLHQLDQTMEIRIDELLRRQEKSIERNCDSEEKK